MIELIEKATTAFSNWAKLSAQFETLQNQLERQQQQIDRIADQVCQMRERLARVEVSVVSPEMMLQLRESVNLVAKNSKLLREPSGGIPPRIRRDANEEL